MTDIHHEELNDDDFDTILSTDIDFTGTLSFEKPFLIRGTLVGEIDAGGGFLMVDKQGVVEARISAPRVIIRGAVKGDISAAERVEVTGTGKLQGNIITPEINMEIGCTFNGLCTMPEKSLQS
ncbi:MAG: polymer-forming cytoskeletal protein [Treponema sp.]|jgi:cytoskeletal protein CcmA (bactofilin family)|nr:polymer-forming cytoskeletal protein [Treponema sp.]